MSVPAPHFVLFSGTVANRRQPKWRFVLSKADGATELEAADAEPDVRSERLELLALVRGLEALGQPSLVTLVTPSRYVNRGLQYGLNEWRNNGWQWERFGKMVPVKDGDLWRRVDRALKYHQVKCRRWRVDSVAVPQESTVDGVSDLTSPREAESNGRSGSNLKSRWRRRGLQLRHWIEETTRTWHLRLAQCGTALLPKPWLE